LRCPTMEAALSARDQLANGDERQAQSWSISLIE